MSFIKKVISQYFDKDEFVLSEADKKDVFNRGIELDKEFLSRFGREINFTGKKILDVGCGLGSLCITMAQAGAERIVGIDMNEDDIRFCEQIIQNEHPEFLEKIRFMVSDNYNSSEDQFDIVISKNSFEHFQEPSNFVESAHQQLKTGGLLVIGFGPFWKSPYGGHLRSVTMFPWAHLIFPEDILLKRLNRMYPDREYTSIEEARGLNKITFKEFKEILRKSKFKKVSLRINQTTKNKLIMNLFTLVGCLPFWKEYFINNVYSIWKKV